MHRVGMAPEIVRRQREYADHPTDPVVGAAPAEERAVAAIVLDHEQADEEARRRNGQEEDEPVADEMQ